MTSPRAWLGLADDPKPGPAPLWWEREPWSGQIPLPVFRAVIAAYIAQFGYYQPDLPLRNPEVLAKYLEGHPHG